MDREPHQDRAFPRFLILSLVLHAGLLGLVAAYPREDAPSVRPEPIYVDVVEPDRIPGLRGRLPAPASRASRKSLARVSPRPVVPESVPAAPPKPAVRSEEAKGAATASEEPPLVPDSQDLGKARTPEPPAGKSTRPGRLPYLSEEMLRKYARVDPRATGLRDRGVTLDTQEFKYLSYLAKVKAKIESVWKYPPTALQRGLRGNLYIRFTIGKDGRVTETVLLRSSGYRMLDEAALKAIRDADPFLPLPESWGEDRLTITGNFIYMLDVYYLR